MAKQTNFSRGFAVGIQASLRIIEGYHARMSQYEREFPDGCPEYCGDEMKSTARVLAEIMMHVNAMTPGVATTHYVKNPHATDTGDRLPPPLS